MTDPKDKPKAEEKVEEKREPTPRELSDHPRKTYLPKRGGSVTLPKPTTPKPAAGKAKGED